MPCYAVLLNIKLHIHAVLRCMSTLLHYLLKWLTWLSMLASELREHFVGVDVRQVYVVCYALCDHMH